MSRAAIVLMAFAMFAAVACAQEEAEAHIMGGGCHATTLWGAVATAIAAQPLATANTFTLFLAALENSDIGQTAVNHAQQTVFLVDNTVMTPLAGGLLNQAARNQFVRAHIVAQKLHYPSGFVNAAILPTLDTTGTATSLTVANTGSPAVVTLTSTSGSVSTVSSTVNNIKACKIILHQVSPAITPA